ncbi:MULTISPECIES: replication initiation protein RepM [Pseudomonas]|jgi:plasmid replication initiation protein|nr:MULTISPECIES: replication initiation protein RepM [Pseudomonas]EXF90942.1 hypothetical protein HK44_029675 [Pseudomonas fluorescens HK44]KMN16029.1 Initiator RepB protein [Pseudomonas weihenstephanensis]WRQ77450.1 replication initiation protein RepM [Pseudomonas saxonica]WRQ77466.1 replication initiation protein RepM [Pseudomonas saxonica]
MAEKSEVVVKSNRLVEASYRLNLVEQQIILFAISRSRDEQLGLSPDKPVTIAASDFAQAFGTNETKVYGQLKEAMGDLFDRSVTIYDTDPDTGKDRTVTTRWISDKAYIDGTGRIQLTFAPRVIPYITRLESEFTSYRLEKISGMSSVHAVRLYELLVQYLTIGKRELALANLRESLGLTNEYKAIKDFKKRVLDTAVAQINEYSDIRVSYTQRKTGRTVTHLIFAIKPEPTSVPVKQKLGKLTDAEVAKRARPGESWEAAHARLNQITLALAE